MSKNEVDELRGFLDRQKELTAEAHAREVELLAEHTPYLHRVTSIDREPYRDGRVVLRCRRCKTDVHYTYAPLNDVLWPCPSVRRVLDIDAYLEVFGLERKADQSKEAS
ncbi:hypothetical protein SEA_CRATER_59 [Gordonia phage Crater]|uniref:Uncharacterized protein n=1 Tax=Gordonia phage Apricot TaxID=2250319 RepID=A0A345L166_9CAUD|nr:hypothetical protein HOT72_gp059 [Gordonia phage Apricot]AXH49018.1 hypothetical protein SEA_APRICOT_59 [Gordonia phage Apricot]WNM69766.1 hypothetical protein SEA_CRATER_59 [Gordonia phage Crater]